MTLPTAKPCEECGRAEPMGSGVVHHRTCSHWRWDPAIDGAGAQLMSAKARTIERDGSTDLLDLNAEVQRLDWSESERSWRAFRAIEIAGVELVAEFVAVHGREPNPTEKLTLIQQATAEVRSAQQRQDARDAEEGK